MVSEYRCLLLDITGRNLSTPFLVSLFANALLGPTFQLVLNHFIQRPC